MLLKQDSNLTYVGKSVQVYKRLTVQFYKIRDSLTKKLSNV